MEVLYLPSDSSLSPTFYISGDQLGLTEQFTCLGSIITSTCDLTAEIQHRVNLASVSFGRLSSEFLRTVTFPHAPRWPFTTQSASRYCSMHVRDGHRTVVTSEPSRPFTFGVFKLSCTCTGGTQYLMLRFAAEQAHHASRRYYSEDNWGGLAMW